MLKVPKLWPKIPNFFLFFQNSAGFSPITVLLLLVVGILGGTYLVQQRTNILPFAAESSDCGARVDSDFCVKKGIPAYEYKPEDDKRYSRSRPIPDSSQTCNNACSNGSMCFETGIFGTGDGLLSAKIKYQCYATIDSSLPNDVYRSGPWGKNWDDGKVTVVANNECNNLCPNNTKCLVNFLPVKAGHEVVTAEDQFPQETVGGKRRNLYDYTCYPTDKISQIPAERLNSVFTAASTNNPNTDLFSADNETCKIPRNIDPGFQGAFCEITFFWNVPDTVKQVKVRGGAQAGGVSVVQGKSGSIKLGFTDPPTNHTVTLIGDDKELASITIKTIPADPVNGTPQVKNATRITPFLDSDLKNRLCGTGGTVELKTCINGSQAALIYDGAEDGNPCTIIAQTQGIPPFSCSSAEVKLTLTAEQLATSNQQNNNSKSDVPTYDGQNVKGLDANGKAGVSQYKSQENGLVCKDNKMYGVKSDGTPSREVLLDCTGTNGQCGKNSSGEYGCFSGNQTAAATTGTGSSSKPSNSDGTSSSSDGTTASDIKDFAEKCGVKLDDQIAGLPFYKLGFGENASVNSENCKKLQDLQQQYFQQQITAAAEKLKNEAQKENLDVQKDEATGQYKVTAKTDENASAEDKQKKEEKAKSIETQLNKTTETSKKVDDCKSKSGADAVTCLGDAKKEVQNTATEAQKTALAGYLNKLNTLLSKFGQKNDQKSDMCVKADLGVAPFMDAKRLKASKGRSENDTTRQRLLICLGSIGDLKWRVLVGGLATDETVTETRPNGSVKTLTGKPGTDDGDACGGKDCGNDAERLWGLYGTESASGGPFWDKYPNGFEINPCVSLHADKTSGKVTPDTVRADLAKYIAAAGGGGNKDTVSTNLPECKKASNPNDTGGNGSQRRAGASSSGSSSSSGASNTKSTTTTKQEVNGITSEITTHSSGGSSTSTSTSTGKKGSSGNKTNECSTTAECLKKNGQDSGYKCDPAKHICYK